MCCHIFHCGLQSIDNENDTTSRYENNCSSPFPSPVSFETSEQIKFNDKQVR